PEERIQWWLISVRQKFVCGKPMGARQVSAGGILLHKEGQRIANDDCNRLAMRSRIALDPVSQGDVNAGHERHVLFSLGTASRSPGGFGHGAVPLSCHT